MDTEPTIPAELWQQLRVEQEARMRRVKSRSRLAWGVGLVALALGLFLLLRS